MATKRRALVEFMLTWECNHPPPYDMSTSELDEVLAYVSSYIQDAFYTRRRTDTLTASKFEIIAQKTDKLEPKGVASPEVLAREQEREYIETYTQRVLRQQREAQNLAALTPTPTPIAILETPTINSPIHQDAAGRWRRANGSFASIEEIHAYQTSHPVSQYVVTQQVNVNNTNPWHTFQFENVVEPEIFEEEEEEEEPSIDELFPPRPVEDENIF